MSPVPRRRQPKASWTLVPLFVLLLLAVAGIGVAGWVHGLKKRGEVPGDVASDDSGSEPAAAPVDPFASVPDEDPRRPSKRPARIAGSAEGLEAEPLWQEALALADDGWRLAEEAAAAKRLEDHAIYNARGSAAREAFDQALEATAEWELEILAEHGETDPAVRKVVRTRSEWFDQLRVLRKTHDGD